MGNETFGDFSVSIFVSGFQMRGGLRETQTLIFPAVNVVVNKSKHRSWKSLVAMRRYLLAKHYALFEGEFVTFRYCLLVTTPEEIRSSSTNNVQQTLAHAEPANPVFDFRVLGCSGLGFYPAG